MPAGVVLFVFLLSTAVFLFLYLAIRSETSSTTVTDRATAEREAREFGGRDDRERRE